MRFTVNALDFRNALRGCAKSVVADDHRPILQYAQFVAKDDAVTITALDGFRMVQYKIASVGDMEPGEALVSPNLALVAIHSADGNATVEIGEGTMRIMTDLPITVPVPVNPGEYIRHEEIWPDPKREQHHVYVNAKFLMQAAQALGVNNGAIRLDVSTDPVKPLAISCGNETFSAKGIIMAVRVAR